MDIFNKYNCETLVIWETDYMKDKEKAINKCITFLIGKNK